MPAAPDVSPPPADVREGGGTRLWPRFKRWLYWLHRWLGVVTCLFCVMWFTTGLVMLYVPFPSWSDTERIASLSTVATEQVRVMPDDALTTSGITTMPTTFRLEMFAGAPVYRIASDSQRASISAVTGAPITSVTAEQALRHVASTFTTVQPQLLDEVDADQWTPTRRFDPHRPLYRIALGDPVGTMVYVSSRTGEIVQNATFSERAWNWVGAVPHWIYFTPIRRDQEFWRQAVMWLSGPLVIGAATGLWIGVLRLRPTALRTGRSISPYRGWMKWHHIAGLIGGLFLTTWIFSGWLSVNPFHWFARNGLTQDQLTAFAGWTPASRLATDGPALRAVPGSTEISFAWLDGKGVMRARRTAASTLHDAAGGQPLAVSDATMIAAAHRLYPAQSVVATERLTRETVYWYSHHDQRPLPAIEVRFDDDAATSIYLDPESAGIAGLIDRSSRANRWLFDFLHDYDLPIVLRNEPARQVLIWLLSLAGLVISISGVVVGWRTLRHSLQ